MPLGKTYDIKQSGCRLTKGQTKRIFNGTELRKLEEIVEAL